jgi:hypothetical protein
MWKIKGGLMDKIKYPDLTLDEAWNLIGEACYTFENKAARHALMLVRGSVADMRMKLGEIPNIFVDKED